MYQEQFEKPFLKATEEYYMRESSFFISQNTIADYMKKMQQRLHQETVRAQSYLHSSSEKNLIQVTEKTLITNHLQTIQNEFQVLLTNDKREGKKAIFLESNFF